MANNESPTSFSKLFSKVIYDEEQISEITLDIWNSYRLKYFPRTLDYMAFDKYQVKQEDTIERIANKFYNNNRLWWLVLLVNNAEDPFTFLEEVRNDNETYKDSKILILKAKYLSDILANIKKIKNIESKNYKVN